MKNVVELYISRNSKMLGQRVYPLLDDILFPIFPWR